jgi:hypothetical protein
LLTVSRATSAHSNVFLTFSFSSTLSFSDIGRLDLSLDCMDMSGKPAWYQLKDKSNFTKQTGEIRLTCVFDGSGLPAGSLAANTHNARISGSAVSPVAGATPVVVASPQPQQVQQAPQVQVQAAVGAPVGQQQQQRPAVAYGNPPAAQQSPQGYPGAVAHHQQQQQQYGSGQPNYNQQPQYQSPPQQQPHYQQQAAYHSGGQPVYQQPQPVYQQVRRNSTASIRQKKTKRGDKINEKTSEDILLTFHSLFFCPFHVFFLLQAPAPVYQQPAPVVYQSQPAAVVFQQPGITFQPAQPVYVQQQPQPVYVQQQPQVVYQQQQPTGQLIGYWPNGQPRYS